MIISPPFLKKLGNANHSIPQVSVDDEMKDGGIGGGAFPISFDGAWHGGIHIKDDDGGVVRVVADGIVHYVRKPTTRPPTPTQEDPQYYRGGWTDDGVVVIRHETEIGENAALVWYSVYMHLGELLSPTGASDANANIVTGSKIWRKDVIGKPGLIYGEPNQIHFEIVLDDENIKVLLGRDPDSLLDMSKDGRSDAVWGECYVYIPRAARMHEEDMRAVQAEAKKGQVEAKNLYSELMAGGDETDVEYIVGILCDSGSCKLTTYTLNGEILGVVEEDVEYEYKLYDEAMRLYPTNAHHGHQLLRFGRILEKNDGVELEDSCHWRKVAISDGRQAWVDLNASGTYKYSDADFPPWKKWRTVKAENGMPAFDAARKIVQAAPEVLGDSLIGEQPDSATEFAPEVASILLQILRGATEQKVISHLICRMPSEWSKENIEDLWGVLKSDVFDRYTSLLSAPMTDNGFERLRKHLEKLAFWSDADLPLYAWRLHPKEFIRAMQRCGWLSANEMYQLFPQTAMRKAQSNWVSEYVQIGISKVKSFSVYLNRSCRLYGVTRLSRIAAFYANAMQETMWFRSLHENNSQARYYPWDGRGFLQLTWPANYLKYWRFVGKVIDMALDERLRSAQVDANSSNSNAPLSDEHLLVPENVKLWRTSIGDVMYANLSADSAGAYWMWSKASRCADVIHRNQYATKNAVGGGSHTYYTNQGMGEVAATVNVGTPSTNFTSVNGIVARFQAYNTCEVVLFDVPVFHESVDQTKPTGYSPRHP